MKERLVGQYTLEIYTNKDVPAKISDSICDDIGDLLEDELKALVVGMQKLYDNIADSWLADQEAQRIERIVAMCNMSYSDILGLINDKKNRTRD